jgi:hypothetical protein
MGGADGGGVLSLLASCDTDPESTDSVTASVASTEVDDATPANTPASVVDQGGSNPPELSAEPTLLVVEPDQLCLRPRSSGTFTLANSSEQQQQYTRLNAWIFDDARLVMYAVRTYTDDPITEGPLEFSTATTLLPIGPSQLAPGESVSLGVRSPTEPGEYTLELDTWTPVPVTLALTVDPNCPTEP